MPEIINLYLTMNKDGLKPKETHSTTKKDTKNISDITPLVHKVRSDFEKSQQKRIDIRDTYRYHPINGIRDKDYAHMPDVDLIKDVQKDYGNFNAYASTKFVRKTKELKKVCRTEIEHTLKHKFDIQTKNQLLTTQKVETELEEYRQEQFEQQLWKTMSMM
ncbi:Hypothetical_protein [Hexamita inflata]|uniref:Hypothetical_protein n=1 Tax=Hexamita inflata TaxID=28002 RepID=A0AA86TG61_9EUKA|nr:Hypothetical protein HINF_LOCUS4320 [Hexamita inflata]CAI9972470.1 Hypothetical protein HINF_LOCUS60115 [Hexamita inflata]